MQDAWYFRRNKWNPVYITWHVHDAIHKKPFSYLLRSWHQETWCRPSAVMMSRSLWSISIIHSITNGIHDTLFVKRIIKSLVDSNVCGIFCLAYLYCNFIVVKFELHFFLINALKFLPNGSRISGLNPVQ